MCINRSLLDPVLEPWWNWLVTLLPTWLHANSITTTGLVINITTSLVLITCYRQDDAGWSSLLCALGVFLYQTLDTIDGRQARRCATGGPLGEFLDHGGGCLSVVFTCMAAAVGLHLAPWQMLILCFGCLALFYLKQWEAYTTGRVRIALIDATEAQWLAIALHLATFFFGHDVWTRDQWLRFSVRCAMGAALALGLVAGAVSRLHVIVSHAEAVDTGLFPAFQLLFPIGLGVVIALKSETAILERMPLVYLTLFGVCIAKVTSRLVVARMTASSLRWFDSVLNGPALILFNQYLAYYFAEHQVLVAALICSVCDIVNYVRLVCQNISSSLKTGSDPSDGTSQYKDNNTLK